MNSVRLEEAFPDGAANPALLPLLSLEVWGFPTSAPARDPGNANFIYQRFQRGIMHYDRACGCTQGLLLADYLKALILDEGVPADLEAQAQGSPLFGSAMSGHLPLGTNYVGAFHGVEARTAPPTPVATAQPTPSASGPSPTPAPTARPQLPVWTSGPYRVEADGGLHAVFNVLQARGYSWVMDRLQQQSIQVSYQTSNAYWGAFIPSQKVIYVNTWLQDALPETTAALLIHEGSHVNDYLAGRLNSFNECISSERVAAQAEAVYWRELWGGVSGKPRPANAYEEQLNFLVAAYYYSAEAFEEFLKEIYVPQCSRYRT
jgi:hypothetical protein